MTTIKIEDSNIAFLGSDLEREVKLAAAETEVMWKDAGKAPGVQVWRVEKLAVNHWPKEETGSFYSGDSYIVLQTYKKKDSDALLYNVFFWLGRETTQDEMGVAAYKTVELDTLLGDVPVQFREVQNSESSAFLSLFGGSLRILSGGVESGFTHVTPEEYTAKLLHVRRPNGAKSIYVKEVPLSWESLNQGDVFILDNGLEIFQWNGATSSAFEKNKAREVVQTIREERLGKPAVSVVDGADASDCEAVYAVVGVPSGQIPDHPTEEPDMTARDLKLFSISDDSGLVSMTLKQTATVGNKLAKDNLEGDNVMMIDAGHSIFVWVGAKASTAERRHGMMYAMSYLKQLNLPASTPICRLSEGQETKAFNAFF